MQNDNETEAPCPGGDCCECPYFLRFEICSPENSTYFLDIYETIWERQRCDAEIRPYGGYSF